MERMDAASKFVIFALYCGILRAGKQDSQYFPFFFFLSFFLILTIDVLVYKVECATNTPTQA